MSAPAVVLKWSEASRTFTRELAAVRCSGCGRIICKRSDADAIRPGQMIEIKCGCNQMNYLMGTIDT